MNTEELAALVEDLRQRVAALEDGPDSSGRRERGRNLEIVQSMIADIPVTDAGVLEHGTAMYAGAGPGPDGLTALQMVRHWEDIVAAEPAAIATTMSALGNPQRVRIVQALVDRPASTAEIAERLEEPTSGQLFHHLKDLLAAGLIFQPARGMYAVRPQHVVPLLTVISAAMDVSGSRVVDRVPAAAPRRSAPG